MHTIKLADGNYSKAHAILLIENMVNAGSKFCVDTLRCKSYNEEDMELNERHLTEMEKLLRSIKASLNSESGDQIDIEATIHIRAKK